MGYSLKMKIFRAFMKRSMKKYVGHEELYISKLLKSRCTNDRYRRKVNVEAPAGFFQSVINTHGVVGEMLGTIEYQPLRLSTKKIIYMLHGGAYHVGMDDTYSGMLQKYSDGKYEVFALDYRTIPEDAFPCAVEDAVEGYKLLLSMGYRPHNIIVAGDGAGGGLALAMALKLREECVERPTTYVLSSPWVDLNRTYTDEEKKDDVLFGWGTVLEKCGLAYANKNSLCNPYISPIYGDLSIFANTDIYISTAKGEMLEGQCCELADKLKDTGARVTFDILNSGVHNAVALYKLNCKESEVAWNKVLKFIRIFTRF